MAEKYKACKECGLLNVEKAKECENCGSSQFLEKYKGKVLVFDSDNSEIAAKLGISANGKYALKYGS